MSPEWIVYNTVDLFFNLWSLAILVRVFLSWFGVSYYHPVARLIFRITEPILAPLRRVVPPIGMLDITPAVAIVALQIIKGVLLEILGRM
ncbi:MAG: YggT family protein [Anaerolineae bacterium]|nr:YggT family protein [Anaerolineae bacterium]MDW8103073.1 YggT family protein [Anaerolineae bacterium]